MPDLTFETVLTGQLRAYAEGGIRPIDRFAIAEATIAGGRPIHRRRGWGSALASSKRVLIPILVGLLVAALVGGAVLVGSRLIRSTSRYEFVTLGDLSRPMAYPQVVPLVDGPVLVIGNGGEGGDPTITAELYDPTTGTSDRLGTISTPRGFIDQAVRLKDGRVLILADGTAQVFDPTTRQLAPVGPMVVPSRAPAVVLRDGRVLMAGGITPGGGVKSGLLSAELLDPETLTFSATGSPVATVGLLVTMPDGRVFVAPDSDDRAQVYDPTTGSFSVAGRLFAPFGVTSAVGLPDGRVFLFGNAGGIADRHPHTEVWDPTSLRFSPAADAPRQVQRATLLADGRILLIGGLDPGRDPIWSGIYDPATGATTPLQGPKAWGPATTRLPDGRVLLVGGLRDGNMVLGADGAMHDAPAVRTVEIFE